MEINKINKKYCADDKVQVMFSNAPSQIILSKEGYLYLREKDITIHRYLADPIRKKMPYQNHPSSKNHATHLFKYDQIYAKFTLYRNMGGSYRGDSYSLTFLYFVRTENGEAFCAELSLDDFKAEEENTKLLSKTELEDFLYNINIEKADAKCIFEWFGGIQYVKHRKEAVSISNNNFLNLSDEEIIKKYNIYRKPMCSIFSPELRAKQEADESWKANNIKEVNSFLLTHHGVFNQYDPMLLVIKGDEMYVYDFTIIFCEKDCFKFKTTKRKISINYNDILKHANNCQYTNDPNFEE